MTATADATTPDETRLRDISPQQWKSGIAAWLGWMFDGLDMHLYTLVATPFVAQLLLTHRDDSQVGYTGSLIQAAFLVGWALGGGFFGMVGDRLGRSRALVLTILTYACFTGLSYFAQSWWELLIYRFLAALGIGGEWAVGASLICETWPAKWRPWLAAILQSGVNIGVLFASVAVYLIVETGQFPERTVFLVGVLPALIVLWIRRAVPETEEWSEARQSAEKPPGIGSLFVGSVRRTTVLTILVCALSLAGHWAFMFWSLQHLRTLPEVQGWTEAERTGLVSRAMGLLMVASILGNFLAAVVAKMIGYRLAIVLMCLAYAGSQLATYAVLRDATTTFWCLGLMGLCQGVFGLFTMYLPPLFPTLLRTTGAGFCYNIGRIAAAFGTVYFGLMARDGQAIDMRLALFGAGMLFIPAAAVAWFMPEGRDTDEGDAA